MSNHTDPRLSKNWWAPGTETRDLPRNPGYAWVHKLDGDSTGGGHLASTVAANLDKKKTAWHHEWGPDEIAKAEETLIRAYAKKQDISPNELPADEYEGLVEVMGRRAYAKVVLVYYDELEVDTSYALRGDGVVQSDGKNLVPRPLRAYEE